MREDTPTVTLRALLCRVWRSCRTVSALLIAGLWRRHSFAETERWLDRLPPGRHRAVVAGTLVTLVGGAFLAAHAGVVGLLVYLLVVILIAR